jgi:hypothetical protein
MAEPPIEVLAVNAAPEVPGFEQARIQHPSAGEPPPGYALRVAGFAVPRDAPLESVTVSFRRGEGRTLHRVARLPAIERRDVAANIPDSPFALRSGFDGSFPVLGLEPETELTVRARREDGSAAVIGSIRLRRHPLESGFQPSLNPLLLICEGRSGSTWLAHLLGCHPRVVAFEPFRFEPRVATYWANVLRTLASPMSYSQSLQPQFRGDPWWTGDERLAPAADLGFDAALDQLLAKDAVEQAAAFCQERIERFYGHVAERQSKHGARFFTERGHGAGWFNAGVIRELYPGGRQVFLVRDFRDVVSSMLAHNRKTGTPSFGRLHAQTDEQFVRDVFTPRVERLVEAWELRGGDAVLVRYEDLVLEPERALGSLLESLGIESDPETVRETLDRAGAGRRERQADHMTAPDPAASVGRWREELSPSLQQTANDVLAGALRAFGYG